MKELSIQEARANAIECINTSEHFVLVSFGSDLDVEVSKAKVIVGEDEISEKMLYVLAQTALFSLCGDDLKQLVDKINSELR